MPLVYLDNCALQRPLDDRDQFRVRIEADAITEVLTAVADGRVSLVTSPALRAEVARGADRSRREFALDVLASAVRNVRVSDETTRRADTFRAAGIRPLDALHLAFAVASGADYFCTTDDRFFAKATRVNTGSMRVVGPLALTDALSL